MKYLAMFQVSFVKTSFSFWWTSAIPICGKLEISTEINKKKTDFAHLSSEIRWREKGSTELAFLLLSPDLEQKQKESHRIPFPLPNKCKPSSSPGSILFSGSLSSNLLLQKSYAFKLSVEHFRSESSFFLLATCTCYKYDIPPLFYWKKP